MSGQRRTLLRKLEGLGHAIFYLTLRISGQRGAYLLLVPVLLTYVLFSRRIHRATRPYLARRFVGHGFFKRWLDTFRLVLSFGQVLVDRAWLGLNANIRFRNTLEGLDDLRALIGQGKGLVLLTAHVGNWQTGISHLCELSAGSNILMQYEEEATAKHYFDLRREERPFNIIKTDGFLGGMIEATAALQKGEIVAMMGDRLTEGPHVTVDLLGEPVRLSTAPFVLAASTGAPLAIVLAFKTGRRSYCMRVWDILHPAFGDRDRRQEALTQWAGRFAQALEDYMRHYPYQWYNFHDTWSQ